MESQGTVHTVSTLVKHELKNHLRLQLSGAVLAVAALAFTAPTVETSASAAPIPSHEVARAHNKLSFIGCKTVGRHAMVYDTLSGNYRAEPYDRTMVLGTKNRCVESLQQNLNLVEKSCPEAALPKLTATELYSRKTATTVRAMQGYMGKYLKVDSAQVRKNGIMNSKTWAILHDDLCPEGTTDLSVHVAGSQLVNGEGKPIRLLGVDVSGTEDACIQDEGNTWIPSTISDETEAAAIAAWHVNAVRVPLNEDCWLGINGAPAAYSGISYQTYIKDWVASLNRVGIYAILDLHWSAPGSYQATQQWPMADSDHSPTFWSQVANTFSNNPAVIFDLLNEPDMGGKDPDAANWSCWLKGCNTTFTGTINGKADTSVTYETAGMQQLVTTVRDTGATQPIMLGGLNWAGDPCGLKDSDVSSNPSCMTVVDKPSDPLNQLAVSLHNYNWTACNTPACWTAEEAALKAAKLPVITGELGEDDCSDSYIDSYMNWADKNKVSYLAWAWQPQPISALSCLADKAGDGMNLDLLSSWNGAPNSIAPEGLSYQAHLAALAKE
jgi:hypothetical protein